MAEVKTSRADLLAKVAEVLKKNTSNPAEELIALGMALTQIGEALKGCSSTDAKQVLKAACVMEGHQFD